MIMQKTTETIVLDIWKQIQTKNLWAVEHEERDD